MSLPSHELGFNPEVIRGVMKPLQEQGVGIEISAGRVVPVLPKDTKITADQIKTLTDYLNHIAPELSGINSRSAEVIATPLEGFQTDPDPNYNKDMIMYGPSQENDFVKKRMERLASVRQAVTEAQNATQPGPDRVGAIKAATFARTHLPDLGLKTVTNFIRASAK